MLYIQGSTQSSLCEILALTSCTGRVPDTDDVKQKEQKQETKLRQNSITQKKQKNLNLYYCEPPW